MGKARQWSSKAGRMTQVSEEEKALKSSKARKDSSIDRNGKMKIVQKDKTTADTQIH